MELLEREQFLELLQNTYSKASTGEGNTVFVTGEPGMGKSTLVRQFLKNVRSGSVQLIGHCDDLFTPRPLAPLHDIALHHAKDLPEFSIQDTSRDELFSSFTDYLRRQMHTAILVFEDIHWADEGTLDFIKFFARRISHIRCLFILTWRNNEVHPGHPLYNVLGDLPSTSLSRLQLTPLSLTAVQQLAAGRKKSPEDLFRITAGNPFFVQELLNSEQVGLPDNVRDAVLATYNREPVTVRTAWQMLSLMPEGIELNRLELFAPGFVEALNTSLERKILLIKNERLVFKHELFRLAISSTLSPISSAKLCREILDLLLPTFVAKHEWSRIVHYARQAGTQELILTYAPKAAADAAFKGAHQEATKLYEAALALVSFDNEQDVLPLYESYAYECYLTSKFDEAIAFTRKALSIYQKKQQTELVGKSLRFLSRLWWFQGNHAESEKYAVQAIAVLEDQPISSVKAMAYSNLSQLYMLQKKKEACLHWGEQAIEMAKQLNDEEVLSHALNNTGSVRIKNSSSNEQGKSLLEESLRLALVNGYHEHAARAYTNLISISVAIKDYDLARKYMEEGLLYCEERDLDSWTTYKLSWKARLLLETGSWPQALAVSQRLLRNEQLPAIVKIGALVIEALITMRQGEQGQIDRLQEAKELALKTEEHQRIMPVMLALMEREWITGTKHLGDDEILRVTSMLSEIDDVCQTSEFSFWLQLTGRSTLQIENLYEPYSLLASGRTDVAAQFWLQKGCLYDAALALFRGDDLQKRKAVEILQTLGATATVRRMQQEMASSGMKNVPRGKRNSTLNNPAQLTNREMEILQLLQRAASNKEISSVLFISPKTVDHHISSILFKLDASSRNKAVVKAIELGVLS